MKQEITTQKRPRKSFGIALIMTLSILLVMSIAASEVLEKTSIELKLLQNNRDQFQVEAYARSAFRAMLIFLSENGANKVALGFHLLCQSTFGECEIAFEGASLLRLHIRSLDHLPVLNLSYRHMDKVRAFNKVAEQTLRQDEVFDDLLATRTLGAIIDWSDEGDDFVSYNGLEGDEGASLFNEEPSLLIKNRGIDFPSELKAIPSARDLLVDKQSGRLKIQFVRNKTDPGCGLSHPFNINMVVGGWKKDRKSLSKLGYQATIVDALSQYDGLDNAGCKFEKISIYGKDLAELVADRTAELSSLNLNLAYEEVAIADENTWRSHVNSLPITPTEANGFFETFSKLIEITYSIEFGSVIKNVRSTLELKYEGDTGKIENVIIQSFDVI